MTVFSLHGVVGYDIVASDFISELSKTTGDIIVDMNSPGGYVTEGVSIFNALRSYDRGKYTARISYAASMMTQIAMAADEIQVYDNAIFMIHNAIGVSYGDYQEMDRRSELLKAMSSMLAKVYTKRTGIPLEEVQGMMDKETWLFGSDIVDKGFADVLIESKDGYSQSEAKAMADTLMQGAVSAMQKEHLSSENLNSAITSCMVDCGIRSSTGASPTASEGNKSENITEGAGMSQNENDSTTLAQIKAFLGLGSADSVVVDPKILASDLVAVRAELDEKISALATQTEMVTTMQSKLTEAVQANNETLTRLREAEANGVSVSVALQMVQAESSEEASKIAIDSKQSNGVTPQNGGSEQGGALLAYAKQIAGGQK